MDNQLLAQEVKNLKRRNFILMGVIVTVISATFIFGIFSSKNMVKTKADKLQSPAIMMDVIDMDSLNARDYELVFSLKERQYLKTIDSLKVAMDALILEQESQLNLENTTPQGTYSTDYVAQMLDYAKQFTGKDCNKSLAFLYAAKKIAQMEKRTGPNTDAIKIMIKKCEDKLFGE